MEQHQSKCNQTQKYLMSQYFLPVQFLKTYNAIVVCSFHFIHSKCALYYQCCLQPCHLIVRSIVLRAQHLTQIQFLDYLTFRIVENLQVKVIFCMHKDFSSPVVLYQR